MKNKITISPGNIKTGAIPSVSLNKSTCRKDAPCFKACYMNKRLNQWKCVGESYGKNTSICLKKPEQYWDDLTTYLCKKEPAFFRFHIQGDIIDASYLNCMISIAKWFPSTKFLAFTKKYELCLAVKKYPKNLSIVFSAWPGFPLPKQSRFPIAYMQDGSETRVKNAIECPGNCDTCGMCWSLKQIKKNVVFKKH